MKRTIQLLALTLLISISSNAQETQTKTNYFGVNLGTNIASFKNEIGGDKNLKLGLVFGINYEMQINDKWAFHTSVNYVQKGTVENTTYSDIGVQSPKEVKINRNHQVVSVPLLFKYNIGVSNNYFINAGSVFNYEFNQKTKFSNDFPESNYKSKQLDLGLSLGFGRKLKLNETNDLLIEIRDNLDIVNLSKNTLTTEPTKANTVNLIFTWQFSL